MRISYSLTSKTQAFTGVINIEKDDIVTRHDERENKYYITSNSGFEYITNSKREFELTLTCLLQVIECEADELCVEGVGHIVGLPSYENSGFFTKVRSRSPLSSSILTAIPETEDRQTNSTELPVQPR